MSFFRKHSVLPGFGITLGYTVLYLSLLVLIPISAMFAKSYVEGWDAFWKAVSSPRVISSYKLTIGTAFVAAVLNAIFGFVLAWTLVRYRFPGRKLIDAMIDLPFALPTAVSGIALTAIYSENGWLGQVFYPLGIQTAFTPIGIIIALTFIGLPFVVRTLQPALEDLDRETEEAAVSLGANRAQTFLKVILPAVMPSLLTGFALSFARALGEYGSIAFISGNIPYKTETTTLLIMFKLDEHDYVGATAIAVVMLLISFVLLFAINVIQWWANQRHRGVA